MMTITDNEGGAVEDTTTSGSCVQCADYQIIPLYSSSVAISMTYIHEFIISL
jgi:hypothetical protein